MNETHMVGRTKAGDPVWQTNRKGRYFTLCEDGVTKRYIFWSFPWPKRWSFRRLPAPHLNYHQVAAVLEKSRIILKELRNGPIYEQGGFYYNRSNKVIMTRAISEIVLHWLNGCGIVLTYTPMNKKRTRVDVDLVATEKNGMLRKEVA